MLMPENEKEKFTFELNSKEKAENGRCPKWFADRAMLAESLAEKIGVLVVANVQGKTRPIDDYEQDSIISEFMTSVELDYLVGGFENAGFYCETVIDEQEFIKWAERKRAGFPKPHLLVYNLAQNGTGAARLSLVPGLCRLYGLRLIDSDTYGVAIARHKFHYTMILRQIGLPAARSWWFTNAGWFPSEPPSGMRLIAKPTFESASIGIDEDSVFEMDSKIHKLLSARAASYRQPLIVQEFIKGFEVEVPVFDAGGPQTVSAVGIEVGGRRNLGDQFLTYGEVACDRYAFYDFADENAPAAQEAMRIAREAFQALGLKGVGRVDFRVKPDGTPLIIEMACKPHLTRHSSFTFALRQMGKTQTDLIKFMIGSAVERYGLPV